MSSAHENQAIMPGKHGAKGLNTCTIHSLVRMQAVACAAEMAPEMQPGCAGISQKRLKWSVHR